MIISTTRLRSRGSSRGRRLSSTNVPREPQKELEVKQQLAPRSFQPRGVCAVDADLDPCDEVGRNPVRLSPTGEGVCIQGKCR
jgi:hypothetical protein